MLVFDSTTFPSSISTTPPGGVNPRPAIWVMYAIDIIVAIEIYYTSILNRNNRKLHQIMHYSQQRSPEYQIERDVLSHIFAHRNIFLSYYIMG